jgi:hypothetical protein
MIFQELFQLLGLICVSGNLAFAVVFSAAFFRLWLERLQASAADGAGD